MNRIAQQFFVLLLLLFCCSQNVNAQYEDLVDSLKKSDQSERRRVFIGILESDGAKIGDNMPEFYQVVKDHMIAIDDKQLLKDIEYQQTKDRRVFNKPKSEWIYELEKLAKEYNKNKEWYYEGGCYHEISQFQFQQEQYGLAFQNGILALRIFKKIGYENTPSIGKVLNEIALNYYFFQDYQEVIKLMRISITLPALTQGLDMQRYNNIGMAYLNLNNIDSAKYYLHKTFGLADKYDFNSWRSITSGSLGNIYYQEKDYQKALKYYLTQVESSENQEHAPEIRVSSYANLAKVYLNLNFISLAKQAIQKTEDTLRQTNFKFLGGTQQKEKIYKTHLENKSHYALRTGDFKNALIYKDSVTEIAESISEKYNVFQIELAANKIKIREHQIQVAETENKEFRQNLGFVVLFVLILAALVFVLFKVYFLQIKKRKQNERLLMQNKISTLEKSQAYNELDQAREQIKLFADKINQQNELVQQLEDDLVKIKKTHQQDAEVVEESLANLKKIKILTEDDWMNFKYNFGKVYPELMHHLRKNSSRFTASEKRYLMLAFLDLSNKEMSDAIGVSETAIRVTLNRVRKKLQASTDESPKTLLNRVTQP